MAAVKFTRRLNGRMNPAMLRHCARYEFRFRCAYCGTHEHDFQDSSYFEIDHFAPRKLFKSKIKSYVNLYYSCRTCNRHKAAFWPTKAQEDAGYSLIDPCETRLIGVHARLYDGGRLEAITAQGQATIDRLRLNRATLVRRRSRRQRRGEEFVTKVHRVVSDLDEWTDALRNLEAIALGLRADAKREAEALQKLASTLRSRQERDQARLTRLRAEIRFVRFPYDQRECEGEAVSSAAG